MVLLRASLALTLFAISDALPAKEQTQPFTVQQIARRNEDGSEVRVVRDGPADYHRALAKYGAAPEHLELVARAAAASGAVSATPPSYADVLYDTPVTVGTQTFKLDIDTGSSDLWILGPKTGAKAPHTLYAPGKSAIHLAGQSWKIGYGDGSSASGIVYSDTVKIGNTVVTGQAVELATTASSGFTTSARSSDGLLGLAFDKLNTIRPQRRGTFMTTAIQQGLPQKLFTCRLKKGQAGTYHFGAINPAEYTGPITYAPVDNSGGFWSFSPVAYWINSAQTVPSSPSVLKGIADTGTTLLLLDDSVVQKYYGSVPTARLASNVGGYVFPCNSRLPSLTFNINGYRATVPGNYMNYAKVNGTHCFGGLQSNKGIGFNIYGDIFLKSQFVVFDLTQAKPRLGFAIPR